MSTDDLKNMLREEGVTYPAENELELIELSRRGVSKRFLLRLSESGSIPMKTLAELLPVTERTIQRYSEEDTFSREVSEHILLIARVLLKVVDLFPDKEDLHRWLTTPVLALGQRTPLSLLDTSFGAQWVIDLLGRMERGVYS